MQVVRRARIVDSFRDFLDDLDMEIEQVTVIVRDPDGEEEWTIMLPESLRSEYRTRSVAMRARLKGAPLTEEEILEQISVVPDGEGRPS